MLQRKHKVDPVKNKVQCLHRKYKADPVKNKVQCYKENTKLIQ